MMYGNYYGYPQQGYYTPNGAMPDMLSQYKGNYQQMPQMQPTQTPAVQANSDMTWVQGEAGAKAYIVAPGHTVPLWDSESPVIYLKSTDTAGVPRMRAFKLTEITADEHRENVIDNKKYVTVDVLEDMIDKRIESKFSELSGKKDGEING